MILHAHDRLAGAEALYRRAAALSGGEFRWTYLLASRSRRQAATQRRRIRCAAC